MATRHQGLLAWLKTAKDADIEKTGTSRGYLRLIGYGHKKAAPEVAAALEVITEGAVTRKELLPDVWKRIWPELMVA